MLVALRRLTIAVIVVIFLLIAAVLAYGNQVPISLDIGLTRFEEVSLTVVLASTFVLGAIFGVLFSVFALIRHVRERRSLRRELRRAETELANLRRMALPDAD